MRGLLFLIFMFGYTALVSRYYYMNGINDAQFDREVANNKIIQCHDLKTRNK